MSCSPGGVRQLPSSWGSTVLGLVSTLTRECDRRRSPCVNYDLSPSSEAGTEPGCPPVMGLAAWSPAAAHLPSWPRRVFPGPIRVGECPPRGILRGKLSERLSRVPHSGRGLSRSLALFSTAKSPATPSSVGGLRYGNVLANPKRARPNGRSNASGTEVCGVRYVIRRTNPNDRP